MRPFVAMQVAFGLVVLFVGSLLVLSFAKLSSVNPGFASLERAADLDGTPSSASNRTQQRAALLEVLDRLRGRPRRRGGQLRPSSACSAGPGPTTSVCPAREHERIETTMAPVTHRVLRDDEDSAARRPRVRVPATWAATTPRPSSSTRRSRGRYFGAGPRGRPHARGRLRRRATTAAHHEVVGVVADTKIRPAQDGRRPRSTSCSGSRHRHRARARRAATRRALAARLRDEIRAAHPLFRVTTVTSQSAAVDQTLLRERLLALLPGSSPSSAWCSRPSASTAC